MTYLKKTLAIFLMVCMLASMMPVGTAFAAGEDGVTASEPSSGGNTPAGDIAGTPSGQSEDTTPETKNAGTTPGTQNEGVPTAAGKAAAEPCAHANTTVIEATAATCTTPGKAAETRCAECDAHISGGEPIEALGHEWTTGRNESVCGRCSEKCTHADDGGATRFDPATGICGVCKYKCDHTKSTADGKTVSTFENGVCSVCKYKCDHTITADGSTVSAFENGVCGVCGFQCTTHTWTTGQEQSVCNVCGTVCIHADGSGTKFDPATGICGVCGFQCTAHTWTTGREQSVCGVCGTVCTHADDGGATRFDPATGECSACGYVCEHQDADGNSTFNAANGKCGVCGYQCTAHSWTTGREQSVCGVCGTVCTHADGSGTKFDPATGECSVCGYVCEHQDADGKSTFNAANGKCGVCGAECAHKNGDKTAFAATEGDSSKRTCSICKFTCSHDAGYAEEKCVKCGYPCPHKDAAGKSTYALDAATGEYVCGVCGKTCTHSKWDTTDAKLAKCKDCGKECDHKKDGQYNFDPATGKCLNGCGFVCQHGEVSNNQCDLCKMAMAAKITKSDASVVYYADVNKAGSSAVNGDTITLLGDAAISDAISLRTKSISFDLNGHSLTVGTDYAFRLYAGAGLIIKNSAENTATINSDYGINIAGNATLTIESKTEVNSLVAQTAGVTVRGANATVNVNGKLNGNGTGIYVIAPNVTVNVNANATVSGGANGILVGDANVNVDGTTVNVSGNLHGGDFALVANGLCKGRTDFEINAGAVVTADKVAIYHPHGGAMNVNGGTITGGETGIEIRGGTVAIGGGTITGYHAIHEQDVQGNGVLGNSDVQIIVGGTADNLVFKGLVYSSDDKITFMDAAEDRPMTVPTTDDPTNPDAVLADANCVHAGAKNEISTGTKTDAVIPKKALEECSVEGDNTIVTVDTPVATVSLNEAALQSINGAVTDSATVHVDEVAGTPEKTYEVYVTDQNGNRIASSSNGATLGGGKATVTLKNVTVEPREVRHLKDDGTTLIEKLAYTYDAAKQTVTVTLTNFSQIVLSANVIPVIDQSSLVIPAAVVGDTVEKQLVATGDPTIQWTVTAGSLPKGLTLSGNGKLSGTVAADAEAKDYKVTVTAANAFGSDAKEMTIRVEEYIAATVYSVGTGDTLVKENSYPSLQEALTNAQAGQVVMLMDDFPTENVIIDKDIVITGDNPTTPRKLKSITFQPGVEGGALYIQADKVTVKKSAYAMLGDGNNIKTVVNENTLGNVDNLDPNVIIDGGHYGSLSPATGGDYLVVNGGTDNPTFDSQIPMEYCREVINAQGGIIQRCAKYNAKTGQYDIVDYRFDITAVSNSGYHMPGSQKTLVFSTNLDYTLADRDRGVCSITVTSGNGSKPISSVYYDITEGKDGKAQITLKASTLNRLALGRYTLRYDGPVGTDSMYFHISNTVRTGDTSNIGLWMGIMGVSVVVLCGVAAVLVLKSKKKKDGAKNKEEKK